MATAPSRSDRHGHRVSLAIGVGIWVLYGPVFAVGLTFADVDYADLAASTDNMVRALVLPLALVAVVLAVAASLLRAWPALFVEPGRTSVPRPVRWLPLIWVAGVLASADYERIADLQRAFLLWVAVGVLLVGFCEELIHRGFVLIGARRSMSESWAALLSCGLFGASHLWNAVVGRSIAEAVSQAVFTFVLGGLLYAIRRGSGGLVVPILLHAAWDFVTFTAESDAFADPNTLRPAREGSAFAVFLLAMLVIVGIYASRLVAPKPEPVVERPTPAEGP